MLLSALLYLVTRHGAADHTGHGRNILAGTATDLMPEHSAYDTADDGTSAYPVVASTSYLDRINYAICNSGIG